MNKAVFIAITIALSFSVSVAVAATSPRTISVSADTKKICAEYAVRNHEKEFSSSRWEYVKTIGDPNDAKFFYQSCLGHITGVPATKEYMKEVN